MPPAASRSPPASGRGAPTTELDPIVISLALKAAREDHDKELELKEE